MQTKFNYSEMKRKAGSEAFKEAHEKEKAKAQDAVDSALYSDPRKKQQSQPPDPDSIIKQEASVVAEPADTSFDNKKHTSLSTRSDISSDVNAFRLSDVDIDAIPVYEPETSTDDRQINEKRDSYKRNNTDVSLRNEEDINRSPKRAVKKSVSNADIPMSVIKRFPSDLAKHIKSLFPAATTMDEALTAYVYIKEGEPPDIPVPSNIQAIIDSYVGDVVTPKDVQEELMKELLRIREMNNKTMRKLNSIELAISYELFDRFGFRKASALTPGELNFLEAGISDLIKQLEKQAELKQTRDTQKSGRPIK